MLFVIQSILIIKIKKMKRNKKPIGVKDNLDKILFLLSAIYLIFVGAWFFKSNKLAASVTDSNSVTKTVVNEDLIITKNNDNSPSNIEKNIEINPKTSSDSQQVSSPMIEQNNNGISSLLLSQNTVNNEQQIIPLNSLLTNTNSNELNQINSSFPQPIKVPIPPRLNNNTRTNNSNKSNNPKITTFAKVNSLPVLNTNSNSQNMQQNSVNPTMTTAFNTVNTGQNNTLVGLIQLENQSSIALFKINDLTAKVKIGEEIGVSGWVLINADEKEAVISQNDQIIRLTVGDNF